MCYRSSASIAASSHIAYFYGLFQHFIGDSMTGFQHSSTSFSRGKQGFDTENKDLKFRN